MLTTILFCFNIISCNSPVKESYPVILSNITYHSYHNHLELACKNWKIALDLVPSIHEKASKDQYNDLILKDIKDDEDFSDEKKTSVEDNHKYFKDNCQNEKTKVVTPSVSI